jgi:hypothetical protein
VTKPTRALLAALAAGVVLTPLSGATAVTPDLASAKPEAYSKPQAGGWRFEDPFGDSEGALTVKAGATPKVKGLTITVTQQDNGAECPAPGTVLKVQGSFPLRKAPKWAEDDYHNKFAWISAKKDRPYDDDYPNMLGMEPVPAAIQVGAQTRTGTLSISFIKLKPSKPHAMKLELRLFPSDGSDGWCLFSEEDGKPSK